MASPKPVPFGLQSYRSSSRPWTAERLVNWYAEPQPKASGAKSPVLLLPRPGLADFSTVGDGPIRGAKDFLGVMYVVSGGSLFSIDEGGSATNLGAISGVGYVQMEANTTQLCIVARPNAWIYTPATTTLTAITDTDFPGSGGVAQLDGYFVHMVPDDSGEFFTSDLDNGLSFDALNFATAESDADPMVRPFVSNGELLLAGTRTIEFWSNNGSGGFPFSRLPNARVQKGCIAPYSLAKCDNTVFWVADDKIIYRLNGYTPERVSTFGIETILDATPDLSDAIAFSHVHKGHTFYVVTSASGEWTISYDVSTGLWAERASYPYEWWKPTTCVQVYGKTYVGDSTAGAVYEIQSDLYTDGSDTIRREVVFPPMFDSGNRFTTSRLEIQFEAGVGLTTGQGSDPQAMLQWSDDGKTWSNEHWRDIGEVGQYGRRTVWNRLGQSRQRTYKLVVSDPVKPVVTGCYIDIQPGTA